MPPVSHRGKGVVGERLPKCTSRDREQSSSELAHERVSARQTRKVPDPLQSLGAAERMRCKSRLVVSSTTRKSIGELASRRVQRSSKAAGRPRSS
mmetsp:Transcript_44280/g.126754  ORF Transcript_44280/g.126754 Transcript_44280/m.126754 type:complete len:95 (+) Transcript_44280:1-285(+)